MPPGIVWRRSISSCEGYEADGLEAPTPCVDEEPKATILSACDEATACFDGGGARGHHGDQGGSGDGAENDAANVEHVSLRKIVQRQRCWIFRRRRTRARSVRDRTDSENGGGIAGVQPRLRAAARSLASFLRMIWPRFSSTMPSACQACSCRFTLSRVTPTLRASCSCVMISVSPEILR